MKNFSLKWAAMTAAGAIVGAMVIYQLKKHTSGVVDD